MELFYCVALRQKLFAIIPLFIVILDLQLEFFNSLASADSPDVHLQTGSKLLAAGQLADALHHFSAACEEDKDNYMAFFKRATVYLAFGKSRSALPDLDRVVMLKPYFLGARLQRASVLLKQGKLDDAVADYQKILAADSGNAEAQERMALIGPLRQNIVDANNLIDADDYYGAIELLSNPIDASPWDPTLRETRANLYTLVEDYSKAVHDLRPSLKLRVDNTEGYLKISNLFYTMGDDEECLINVRECLKLDQENKLCKALYKQVKKLSKRLNQIQDDINENRWKDCLESITAARAIEPKEPSFQSQFQRRSCLCHSRNGDIQEGIPVCVQVIEANGEGVIDAMCDKAELLIMDGMYEAAINDYRAAIEIEDVARAKEGLRKAEQLLKQSKKRDYYKILGVRRNASKKEIIKAYRKLAKKWHPDNYSGPEKESAQKNFIDLADAKEVLTNPDKRQIFDNGEDPLDAQQQAERNNPFHGWGNQGFNPFGGGGGFKFHFS